MPTKNYWTQRELNGGIVEFTLDSWKYFGNFINDEMLSFTDYIFRGHGDATWKLEPTIDRIITDLSSLQRENHLEKFKYEIRARRGNNPQALTDEEVWALGQHYGLYTPLLDWTESPFVALFFAVSDALSRRDKNNISVHALWQSGVQKINTEIENNNSIDDEYKSLVKFIRPLTDENNRLINQRGLFTIGSNNMDLEQWILKFNQNIPNLDEIILAKIIIPYDDLEDCLRYLNRMNISNSTLFPDLHGASMHCNQHLSLKNY